MRLVARFSVEKLLPLQIDEPLFKFCKSTIVGHPTEDECCINETMPGILLEQLSHCVASALVAVSGVLIPFGRGALHMHHSASRFSLSASIFALGGAFAAPVFAQTES